jgi:hypothetical protein
MATKTKTSPARAIAADVIEQLESSGISNRVAAVNAVQQTAGFAQHQIQEAGGLGAANEVVSLLLGAAKLMLGYGHVATRVPFEAVADELHRLSSVRSAGEATAAPRHPHTAKDFAAGVMFTLRNAGLVRPETELAIHQLLAAAGAHTGALGESGRHDAVGAILSAAAQVAMASQSLVMEQGRPEDFRNFLAILHRMLAVRAVPDDRRPAAG